MSDLVIVTFKAKHTAFEMRAALARMLKEYLLEMEDYIVVTRNTKGKAKLHQAMSLTTASAVSGGWDKYNASGAWDHVQILDQNRSLSSALGAQKFGDQRASSWEKHGWQDRGSPGGHFGGFSGFR